MVTVAGSIYDYNVTGRLDTAGGHLANAGVSLSQVSLRLTGGPSPSPSRLMGSKSPRRSRPRSGELRQRGERVADSSRQRTTPELAVVKTHRTLPKLPAATRRRAASAYVQRVTTTQLAGDVSNFDKDLPPRSGSSSHRHAMWS